VLQIIYQKPTQHGWASIVCFSLSKLNDQGSILLLKKEDLLGIIAPVEQKFTTSTPTVLDSFRSRQFAFVTSDTSGRFHFCHERHQNYSSSVIYFCLLRYLNSFRNSALFGWALSNCNLRYLSSCRSYSFFVSALSNGESITSS
jgi:hypothetical protein